MNMLQLIDIHWISRLTLGFNELSIFLYWFQILSQKERE